VETEIISKIDSIVIMPTRFAQDKYKLNNDGSYRYFEMHRCRISFRIYENYIRILSVRSKDQDPLQY
jgi:hypothetical protein